MDQEVTPQPAHLADIAPPRWSREDVQRVLYEVVTAYEGANSYAYTSFTDGKREERKMPRRFILFGRRLPFLGGDSEILRNRIDIARQTLKDNDWWPTHNDGEPHG